MGNPFQVRRKPVFNTLENGQHASELQRMETDLG